MIIPVTSDLTCLKEYLDKETEDATREGHRRYESWVTVAEKTIVRIVLFNKRRISEVEELKILDFKNRMCHSFGRNKDIYQLLNISEKTLG